MESDLTKEINRNKRNELAILCMKQIIHELSDEEVTYELEMLKEAQKFFNNNGECNCEKN